MRRFKTTGFAEGLSTFVFLMEYFYLKYIMRLPLSFQTVSAEVLQGAMSSMLAIALLVSFMGHRLIYQHGWLDTRKPVMRKYGYIWFFLFYGLHLGFSLFLDVWFISIGNHRWIGLLLFLLKLAAVLYFGFVLRRAQKISILESTQELAPPGNRRAIFGIVGLFLLMAVDICFITPNSILYNVVEFLELAIMVFLYFGFRHEDAPTAHSP